MAPIPHYAALAIFALAFVAWIVAFWHFQILANEFRNAKRSGMFPTLPANGRGLPPMIIFTNMLPRVEKERRRLVWSLATFVGLILAFPVLLEFFGPRH